jgi:sulfatase maturation enzyme AslB (radical SAM superfamily)
LCQPPLKLAQQPCKQHNKDQVDQCNAQQGEHGVVGTVHNALCSIQQLLAADGGDQGSILEQDDELALLKNEHSKAVGINGTYELTLLPSLDCNLRCWYCFEKHIKPYIDTCISEINDSTNDWVDKKIEVDGVTCYAIVCPHCMTFFNSAMMTYGNYCPQCGARMIHTTK